MGGRRQHGQSTLLHTWIRTATRRQASSISASRFARLPNSPRCCRRGYGCGLATGPNRLAARALALAPPASRLRGGALVTSVSSSRSAAAATSSTARRNAASLARDGLLAPDAVTRTAAHHRRGRCSRGFTAARAPPGRMGAPTLPQPLFERPATAGTLVVIPLCSSEWWLWESTASAVAVLGEDRNR